DMFRPLVVVDSNEPDQIARAKKRDELSEEQARARLGAQLSSKEKVPFADHVIHNDGDLADLYRRADDVLDAICEERGVDPSRHHDVGLPADVGELARS